MVLVGASIASDISMTGVIRDVCMPLLYVELEPEPTWQDFPLEIEASVFEDHEFPTVHEVNISQL